jgi:hypothetical protein
MDLSATIAYLKPGAVWTMDNEDITTLKFLSDDVAPTLSECEAIWPEVKAKLDEIAEAREKARDAVLAKIGLTEDEVALLLG